MRRKVGFAIGLLMAFAVTPLAAQSCAHYEQLFWEQMKETCRPGLRWEKSVTEVAEDGATKTEAKSFELDCIGGFAIEKTSKISLNPEEFGHLFEFTFDNPYYSDYLDLVRNGQSIVAKVKAGKEGKTKLHSQRFDIDPSSGRLLFAEAHILKNSPLYELEVHIQVWFDAVGHYERHAIETKTDVLMGGELHTLIKAQLLP